LLAGETNACSQWRKREMLAGKYRTALLAPLAPDSSCECTYPHFPPTSTQIPTAACGLRCARRCARSGTPPLQGRSRLERGTGACAPPTGRCRGARGWSPERAAWRANSARRGVPARRARQKRAARRPAIATRTRRCTWVVVYEKC